MIPRRRRWRARTVIGTAVLLSAVLACIRLGFWQLDRLRQRRALNEQVAGRLREPVLQGAGALADTARSLYRRVALAGQYDDPRSIVLPGRSLEGVPGVHLLTPLRLGPDEAVLVNRGWVPSPDAATIPLDSFPAAPPGTPEVRLTGLVLPLPFSARAAAPTSADSGFRQVWYRLEPRALQAQFPYRLLPVQVQLLPSLAAPRFPARLPPPALDEGPHLSYAIQWFSFAAIGTIGWLALARRARQNRDHDRAGAAPLDLRSPGAEVDTDPAVQRAHGPEAEA